MTEPDSSGRFTLWKLILICAAVVVSTAGATWGLARAYVSDELAQYRASEKWDLPENLKKLGDVSQKLTMTLDERSELEKLRQEVKLLGEKSKQLEDKLKSTSDENEKLKAEFAKLHADNFVVTKGQSHFIVPGILAVGVNDTSTILNHASIQFGKKAYARVQPGTPFEEIVEGTKYILTLTKIEYDSCTFVIVKRAAK